LSERIEIIVDNFAGGGGTSTGIEAALGRPVDIAINHDPVALAMYKVNHPNTKLYCESVWDVDPREAAAGRPIALCWLSPDCKHFSKAKGGKPMEKNIRSLAWVALRWAATVHPRVIMLENVEEFTTWGPLLDDGKPDPKQKGITFRSFVNALRRQGYQVDYRELKACDYGSPTIRKRFFLVARNDGRPIIWPEPTHGDPRSDAVKSGRLLLWHTAAEIIDWSIPCPSIFGRKKPLVENTMRRIAKGIFKFVIDNPHPFILNYKFENEPESLHRPLSTVTSVNGHYLVAPVMARDYSKSTAASINDPLGTVTVKDKSLLCATFLSKYHGEKSNTDTRGQILEDPIRTLDTSNRFSLITANLAKNYGGNYDGPGSGMNEPLGTVTTKDHNALVTSHLIKLRGTCKDGQTVMESMPTITAGGLHVGEVRAFLMKYYGTGVGQNLSDPLGTVTTRHRFGLVTVAGVDYQIADIGMRMLVARELYRGQGFLDSYIIDRDANGKKLSQATQVKLCGNAVPPQLSEALVRANLPDLCAGVSYSDNVAGVTIG
jgi:DNA (cytosine-5)-methyltransferase 1